MADNSYWIETAPLKLSHKSLSENIEVDVVIIGGGITGITTAYLLSKSGKKVALLDKGGLASGETAYTTAFLTSYPDTPIQGIKDNWDIEKVKWVLKSGDEAIRLIEEISKNENIECEFERLPVFVYAPTSKDGDWLKKESEVANQAGYDFKFKDDHKILPKNEGYIEVPNQAKFHPLKYLSQLINVLDKDGVQIFENTLVQDIKDNSDSVIVETEDGHKVTAKYAVMATHNTFGGPYIVQTELEPYNTYVICAEVTKPELSKNLYWDTEDPYNYLRIDKSDDGKTILMLGGCDHPTGEPVNDASEKYNRLESYLKRIIPDIEYKIILRWSGQVVETADGLPYIGFLPEKKHILVSTGLAGNGMTFGTLSGRIFTDLIKGNENELTKLYSLTRIKGVGKIIKKGVHMAKEYYRKYFGSFEHADVDAMANDSGKVCEGNGKKVAIYKSKDGKVTKLSAYCTHMGCVVNWNDDQKSWDCPCHGSRFLSDGKVMGGPATKPLEKVE